MADATIDLLKSSFRQLRLPSMSREFERLARDAAATNQNYFEFLLRLAESELATRAAATISRRIKDAKFPVLKDFEIYDFSVLPQLSKPKVLELARCDWIEHKYNCCLVGSHGTGKTHISIALGQAGVIAPVPGIMRLFWAFSPSNPPESPSQEDSSLANMLDTLEARCRSDGPPAGPRSIDPLPGSRSFLTVSAVA